MRDIFEDIFKSDPLDPMESARRGARPVLRARFYKLAEAREGEGGFAILLDGRPVRTPAKRPLAAPARAIADAIAAEWDAQRDTIDPARMPLTRLANSIIDGVVDAGAPVRAEIAKFLGSDLLFYRADGPEGLIEQQAQHWDPVLGWAQRALDARFVLVQGVTFAPQPDEAIAAAAAAIPENAWRLGAVHSITTLTGSALLALAVAHGALGLDEAWRAAHVDEDWNMAQWGVDPLALERSAYREAEMRAAVQILSALKL